MHQELKEINDQTTSLNIAPEINSPKPWRRYFARQTDLIIFFFIILLFAQLSNHDFFSNLSHPMTIALNMAGLLIYAIIEALILCSIGTTFGKWIFRIYLINIQGKKPTFSQALKRSFGVWFSGLAMGAPFVYLFTLGSAYKDLTERGNTSWDKEKFIISYGKVSFIRGFFLIFLSLFCFFAILAGSFIKN